MHLSLKKLHRIHWPFWG